MLSLGVECDGDHFRVLSDELYLPDTTQFQDPSLGISPELKAWLAVTVCTIRSAFPQPSAGSRALLLLDVTSDRHFPESVT